MSYGIDNCNATPLRSERETLKTDPSTDEYWNPDGSSPLREASFGGNMADLMKGTLDFLAENQNEPK